LGLDEGCVQILARPGILSKLNYPLAEYLRVFFSLGDLTQHVQRVLRITHFGEMSLKLELQLWPIRGPVRLEITTDVIARGPYRRLIRNSDRLFGEQFID
jgi:hypothetical protein